MVTDETTMTEKQWWEHRVPFVDFKCSCPECVYNGSTDLSGVETFTLKCKKFGRLRKSKRWNLGEHLPYLAEYREKILEPMTASYSARRKAEDGKMQVLLIGHRHSFHELKWEGWGLTDEEAKEKTEMAKERAVHEQRIHRSIPVFPTWFDPGATFELFEHAVKALQFVIKEHGSGQPIELHVQLGSGVAATGALLHALYHYRIYNKDAKVEIFTYFVDNDYDGDWTDRGLDAKLHQMKLPRLDGVVPS